MPRVKGAERRLYRDLSGLLAALRARPLAEVEAAIEARFRRYLGDPAHSPVDTLSVTLSWQLPEGAESWALYETEFRVEARAHPAGGAAPAPATAVAAGNVIPFPASSAADRRRRQR
ncbi:MAG: hypothetical protein MUE49_09195 [Rhodospirillales bacterium]|jgi:hypothetical protein|nr:hypothetical protein [Rhodospirillales bacterium]